jgi:hypothetical protein
MVVHVGEMTGDGGQVTDIKSVYGAWGMKSIRVRRPRGLYNLGTEYLATIESCHRPSINPRLHLNGLTGGAARDVRGSGEFVGHR